MSDVFADGESFLQARYPRACTRPFSAALNYLEPPPPRRKEVRGFIAYDADGGAKQILFAVPSLRAEDVKTLCTSIDKNLPMIEGGLVIQMSNANDPHGNVTTSDKMPRGNKLLFFTDAVGDDVATIRAAVPDFEIAIIDRATAHLHIRADMHTPFSQYHSVFISYGSTDEAVAARINTALKDAGVKTWFFKDDALPGQKLHRMMSEGVAGHDRVLFLCSGKSLSRSGVLNELERVLERETREAGADLLMPIALDEHVFKDWAPTRPDVGDQVRSRVIGDLTGTDTDPDKFKAQIARVLKALKRT